MKVTDMTFDPRTAGAAADVGVTFDRRQALLTGFAMAAVALSPGTVLAQDDDPALTQKEKEVVGMIRPLTGGFPPGEFTVHHFIRAMEAELGKDDLAKLAETIRNHPGDTMTPAITEAGLDNLANRVIEIMYTGIVEKDGEKITLHYTETLQWQVGTYTKPPTTCGPQFGYWKDPPYS